MKNKDKLRDVALASSLSFIMAGSIVAGYLIGQYLDRRLRNDGLLTVLFILLGILLDFIMCTEL